jgi:hypothetical protein
MQKSVKNNKSYMENGKKVRTYINKNKTAIETPLEQE